jgi:hypothetical protein
MAEMEMFDYLNDTVADYTTEELSVTPQRVLTSVGEKSQVAHKFDDGSRGVVSISDQSYFTVSLQWDVISKSDKGTIMDLYHSTTKANGMEYTFYWQHPTDSHTYVARFLEPLRTVIKGSIPSYREVSQIKLGIEGRKAEA